jgi:DNA-binding beta-propeller fold protein YncE
VAAWGGLGSGPGEFNDPIGIAATATEVFVADARNGRIQVFDHEGRFKRAFGQGLLGRPMNLTIAGAEIYVADYWHDRIQVFALGGTPGRTIGRAGSGPGEFNAPGGVAVAPDSDLYASDLYATDFYHHRIQRLRADGSFVRQWGTTGRPGWRAGEFIYPTDVALAPDGRLYVADGYADRIQAFNPDGSFSHKWGGPLALNIHGPFRGWFATVTSVAVGPEGHVYAADFHNDRVQKFTAEGVFLTAFGVPGDGVAHTVMGVDVAEGGTVFVTDPANHRVQKWAPTSVRF